MNVYFLAGILLLAGVTVGALSVLVLRKWVCFLKHSYLHATKPGEIADEREKHLVAKSLIADGIAIGFITGITGFAGIACGWCYISACLFGSWTLGVASVCMGAWSAVIFLWGPRLSGELRD